MIGIYLLVPTLLTILLSFLIIRAGAIALMMTGMDQERARFQALSAFSRAGFTTREAEMVVNNPRRRRIISWLIILGNAGLVAIIVTATRTAQTADATLASVTVITLEDLETARAQTIVEVLQNVAGIHISRSGGIGKSTSFYMRGTESDHTLVLIDGVRASSATTGGYAWNSLSPEQIERIEIVRGPRASLYGSDAIGGVIQIFTRKNKRSQVELGYGSQDTSKMNISLAGGKDWRYSFITGHQKSNGIPIQPTSDERRGYDNTHAALTLDGNINDDNKLNVNINNSQGTNELDPGTGNEDFTNRVINVQLQQKTSTTWNQKLNRFENESSFIVSGYCFIWQTTGNDRPEIVRYENDENRKIWVKTTMEKQSGTRELCIDSIMGVPQSGTKYGRNFGQVPGGIWSQSQVYDQTSHLKNDQEPAGGNIGFLDGHVEWRAFEPEIRNGVALPRFGSSPGFFW